MIHFLTLDEVLESHAAQIATYGGSVYGAVHNPEALYVVAGGLARTGHPDDAMVWLSRAVQDQPDHQRLATDLGARGTPTFFINGRKLVGAQPVTVQAAEVSQALATGVNEVSPRLRFW